MSDIYDACLDLRTDEEKYKDSLEDISLIENEIPTWAVEENEEGKKHDTDKPRMDLLSPISLLGMAEVFTFGAKKYSDRNWENGIKMSRLYAALLRHLMFFQMRDDIDFESGLKHIDHAACCLHMMQHILKTKPEFDDRPGDSSES